MSPSPLRLAAMALFATALLAACEKSSSPSGNVDAGPARGSAERIFIDERSFEPGTLELSAGEEVVVEIANEDGGAHDFAIDDLDLNTGNIAPGEVATAQLRVPDGTTTFRCTYHSGMEGRIEAR